MAKKTITRAENLQIVGLLALAARHQAMLKDILLSLEEITGESADEGHCCDAVYDHLNPLTLIERLDITVEG